MKSEQQLDHSPEQSKQLRFRRIFQQYQGYVYAIIWYRIRGIGTREDAEEAVSDVFVKFFANMDHVEEGKIQNYLRVIAKHTAIDTFRRLTSRHEVLDDEEHTWEEAVSPQNIERDHEISEIRQEILNQIKALGEPDATIITMRFLYNCSTEEIAKTVGMSQMNVRTRQTRARKRLQAALNAKGITVDGGS